MSSSQHKLKEALISLKDEVRKLREEVTEIREFNEYIVSILCSTRDSSAEKHALTAEEVESCLASFPDQGMESNESSPLEHDLDLASKKRISH